MTESQVYNVIGILIPAAGIWALLRCLLPAYFIDKFRSRLFELRGEIFQFAANGNIAFDHPTYTTLRSTINGMPRFAHRLSWTEIFLAMRFPEAYAHSASFSDKLEAELANLPTEVQEGIKSFKVRLGQIVLVHLLVSSPILLATIILPLLSWIMSYYSTLLAMR